MRKSGKTLVITAIIMALVCPVMSFGNVAHATAGDYLIVSGSSNCGNLRASASSSSAIVCAIQNGESVEIITEGTTWKYVKYIRDNVLFGGQGISVFYGYLHTSVIKPYVQCAAWVTDTTGMNIRSAPNGTVLINVPYKRCVMYASADWNVTPWRVVTYNGVTGYAYISLTDRPSVCVNAGCSVYFPQTGYSAQPDTWLKVTDPFESANLRYIVEEDVQNLFTAYALRENVTALQFG